MARRKKKKRASFAVSMLKMGIYSLLVLVCVYCLVTYVFRRSVVRGVSMQNTLFDGDSIIMDELSYNTGDPKRYDVICFKSYKEKELLIKRIIGLPGEKIQIIDGKILIDDEQIKDIKGLSEIEDAGVAKFGITLDDDEYFVIGDNRAESVDSRFNEVGNIKRKEILGKAALVFWPPKHIKVIK